MKKRTITKLPGEFDQDYAHWKVLKRTGNIVLLEARGDAVRTHWEVCPVKQEKNGMEYVSTSGNIGDNFYKLELMQEAFDKTVERVSQMQEKHRADIEAKRNRIAADNAYNKMAGMVSRKGRELARELKQAVSEYEGTEPQADKKIKALLTEIGNIEILLKYGRK